MSFFLDTNSRPSFFIFGQKLFVSIMELFPYQLEGVRAIIHGLTITTYLGTNRMYPQHAFLLYDEMGMGKTIQALTALKQLEPESVLILAPAACLHVWGTEYTVC